MGERGAGKGPGKGPGAGPGPWGAGEGAVQVDERVEVLTAEEGTGELDWWDAVVTRVALPPPAPAARGEVEVVFLDDHGARTSAQQVPPPVARAGASGLACPLPPSCTSA